MSAQHNAKIGVATATIIGMNAMIGSGIFTAPATMASCVGPAGILAYVFVVAAVWCIAQSLARLAYLFPEEGSFYVYAKQWGGHTVGLLASSAYFIGMLIAMGLLSQMSGQYLHTYFPAVSAYALGLITLAILVGINMFGVKLSSLGQHIIIASTVFPLIATIGMCLTKVNLSYLSPFAPYGFTHVLQATRVVIFGFFGFECATSLFNIVDRPEQNVPRALTYSILLVGVIYTLFVGSIILSTPLSLFTDPRTPLSQTLAHVFPDHAWLMWSIHFAILSAIVGTIHSMLWSSSHLLALLMKKFQNKNIQHMVARNFFSTRVCVSLVGSAIVVSYVMLKNTNLFFCLTALFVVSVYIASMITLLTIKQEWRSGRNSICIIGIITAAMIFIFAAQGLMQEVCI